ncbi:malonate decarboxylase holo-ACP synthase [Inquilinus limosus]|uniref:malonate decarboxylase holo-ACP synthase n=1 Tax=Inquilinus limosus TaxID=171674 RepID=UPI003F16BEC1
MSGGFYRPSPRHPRESGDLVTPGLERDSRFRGNDVQEQGGSFEKTVQPHDLLRIDPAALANLTRDLPGWAAASLAAMPWVVVRRAPAYAGLLPVGIRGSNRAERCAAWLPPAAVVERRTPEDLAAARGWQARPHRTEVPALAALDIVADLLSGSDWGPAGSIGFELATGHPAAHRDSDLDIVLRAPGRIGRGEAERILAGLAELPVRVDVVLETPLGACSLAEIAAGRPAVVKTPVGPRLVRDPWAAAA